MNASNLWGSVGSMAGKFMSSFGNNVSKGMNATVAAVSDGISAINEEFMNDGEEHYFEEDRSVEEVRVILNKGSGRNREEDKIGVMKWLIAQLSKGVDVSEFFPDIVKLVIASNVELKHYVYIFLIHYCDYNDSCRENALLSVNTFQQDMAGKNPRIRALALRVMTSIRVPDIWQLQLMAVQKLVVDSVPFVRKIAAHALLKLYQYDPSQEENVISILKILLRETNSLVFSSAIIAYSEICPTRFDLLNPCFRRMLEMLPLLEDSAQAVALTVLMKYARTQFIQPTAADVSAFEKVKETPVMKAALAPIKQTKLKIQNSKLDSFYGSESESESDSYYSESEEEAPKKEEKKVEKGEEEKAGEAAEESVLGKRVVDPDLIALLTVADTLLMSMSPSVVLAASSMILHLAPTGCTMVEHAIYTLVQLLNRDYYTTYVVLNIIDELSALDLTMFAGYVKDFFPRISEPAYIVNTKTRILCRLITKETVEEVLAALQPFAVHPSADVVTMLIKTLLVICQKNPSSARLCLRVCVQLLEVRLQDSVIAHTCLMAVDRLLHVLDESAKKEALMWTMKLIAVGEQRDLYDGLLRLLLHHCELVIPQTEEVCRLILKDYENTSKNTRLVLLLLLVKLRSVEKENATVEKMLQYAYMLNSRDLDVDVRVQARNIHALTTAGNAVLDEALQRVLTLDNRANEELSECHLGEFYIGSLSLILNTPVKGYTPLPEWTEVPVPGEFRDPVAIERKEREEKERKERERKEKERAAKKGDKKAAKVEEYSDYSYYSDYSDEEPAAKKKEEKKEKAAPAKKEKEDYSYSDYSDYSYSEDEKAAPAKKEEKKEEGEEKAAPAKKEEDYSDYSYSDYSYSD